MIHTRKVHTRASAKSSLCLIKHHGNVIYLFLSFPVALGGGGFVSIKLGEMDNIAHQENGAMTSMIKNHHVNP
jgi:hypothetical protein